MKYKVISIKFAFPVFLKKRSTFYFSEGDKRYQGMEAIADLEKGYCIINDKGAKEVVLVPMQGNVIFAKIGERLDGQNSTQSANLAKARAAKAAKKAS